MPAAGPIWLAEWLSAVVDLRPGMRILDLGCGRAMSSIFLSREFGVQVWATDLWFSASENLQRIRDAGVGEGVYPIYTEARALPFATDFFDAIISIDSFPYYSLQRDIRDGARGIRPGQVGCRLVSGRPVPHVYRVGYEKGPRLVAAAAIRQQETGTVS